MSQDFEIAASPRPAGLDQPMAPATPFRQTFWAMMSSIALHSLLTATLLFSLLLPGDPPKPELVEIVSLEFIEDSAEAESPEEREAPGDIESLTELDESLEAFSPQESHHKSALALGLKAGQAFEDSLSELTELSLEREQEAQRKIELELSEGQSSMEKEIDELGALAQRAKDLMTSILEAEMAEKAAAEKAAAEKAAAEAAKKGTSEQAGPKGGGGSSTRVTTLPRVVERIRSRGDGEILESLEKNDVYVVRGCYDAVEHVLMHLGVPFTLIDKKHLETKRISPDAVLVLNCDRSQLGKAGAVAVRNFVNAGGYVFSSDWELHNVLTLSFADILSAGRKTRPSTVPIVPYPKFQAHPFLKDVFDPISRDRSNPYRWVIDASSDTPVFRSRKVKPLVLSHEFATAHRDNGIIAFTFPLGKGHVMHVISHFRSQLRARDDGYALQQMLANFIVEKHRTKRRR